MCDKPCPCETCTRRRSIEYGSSSKLRSTSRFDDWLDYAYVRPTAGRTGALTREWSGTTERNATEFWYPERSTRPIEHSIMEDRSTERLGNKNTYSKEHPRMNAMATGRYGVEMRPTSGETNVRNLATGRYGVEMRPTSGETNVRNLATYASGSRSAIERARNNVRPSERYDSRMIWSLDDVNTDVQPTKTYQAEVQYTNRQGLENAVAQSINTNIKNIENQSLTKKGSFGVGAEAGFAYFLSETIGIIGFCVITTFCLWALLMKFGIQLLARIHKTDKRVRAGILLLILIVSIVVFQGLLLRKVKNLTHVKKNAVKITPKKSKIVVAQSTNTKGYWLKLKDGVTGVWISFKDGVFKMIVRVMDTWLIRSMSSYSNVARISSKTILKPRQSILSAVKELSNNIKVEPQGFLSATKETTNNIKTTIIGLLRWPFEKRSPTTKLPQKPDPSFWSSCKATVYNMPATVRSHFYRTNSTTPVSKSSSKSKQNETAVTTKWKWSFWSSSSSCQLCKQDVVQSWNWKFWSNWRADSIKTGAIQIGYKIKSFFTAPPMQEDPAAREVMQQSKLYAIPMEMKRPPQFFVILRDYFQR